MEDYEHRLEARIRGMGWPDDRVRQFTRFVMHDTLGTAEFALEVIDFVQEVHAEMDHALVGQESLAVEA